MKRSEDWEEEEDKSSGGGRCMIRDLRAALPPGQFKLRGCIKAFGVVRYPSWDKFYGKYRYLNSKIPGVLLSYICTVLHADF